MPNQKRYGPAPYQELPVKLDSICQCQNRNEQPGYRNGRERQHISIRPQQQSGTKRQHAGSSKVRPGRNTNLGQTEFFTRPFTLARNLRQRFQSLDLVSVVHLACFSNPEQSTLTSNENVPRPLPGSV